MCDKVRTPVRPGVSQRSTDIGFFPSVQGEAAPGVQSHQSHDAPVEQQLGKAHLKGAGGGRERETAMEGMGREPRINMRSPTGSPLRHV